MLFNQLKQQLEYELTQIIPNKGLIKIEVQSNKKAENTLFLRWLNAQSIFPKFYWQNRDDNLTLTAIGTVKSFDNIQQAQQFNQQNNNTLLGGIKFCGQTTFILPRLLFAKNQKKMTACLMVDTDHLDTEIPQIHDILEKFDNASTLNQTQYTILETTQATDFSQWSRNIQSAIEKIKQGCFNKVVLANATNFKCKETISAYELLALSQQKNQHCFHFLYQEDRYSAFIGSSPERLYKREQQRFYTEALAGTVAVTEDPTQTEKNGQWLLNDSKNTLENQYVVDDICSHLAPYISSVIVSDIHLKRLPKVQHLRRFIEMQLKENISDIDCLNQIHPTAAIAGLPRPNAIEFINQTENFKRQWYAGTLGFFNQAQAEFCVTLRSAQINKNTITIYAGAGIMQDSDPHSEWQEIERKALAMAELLK
ncbi:Menaquinone-specific isochorismate synthase [Phocoenobacter uteri]|uniref:Isochorismate synthase MenF n=1 Tax=Phocoenobacter uteri TaxID=146806 RepID=A0A379C954_9PAST|nr:isochorismate synthase [Phocoenobacter uteri]SUB58699.1 Menaquinone-specific isochorismate synthase [Phocoenobacter uteri]